MRHEKEIFLGQKVLKKTGNLLRNAKGVEKRRRRIEEKYLRAYKCIHFSNGWLGIR